jgi:hypothetical protein
MVRPQTTNLGVGSSNLSRRAKLNNHGVKRRLDLGFFAADRFGSTVVQGRGVRRALASAGYRKPAGPGHILADRTIGALTEALAAKLNPQNLRMAGADRIRGGEAYAG